jgi:AcrR family transcriptional regulator
MGTSVQSGREILTANFWDASENWRQGRIAGMLTVLSRLGVQILDAAAALFSEKPFDDVHMNEIAAGAKVSKVTLYKYFQSKTELYLKLLKVVGQQYLDRVRRAEATARGCRARLVAMAREAMRYFTENRHVLRLLDRAGIDLDRTKEEFPWRDTQLEFFSLAKGIFAEGVATGEFMVEDLDLAVRGLVGTMRFQFLYPCDSIDHEAVPDKIVGLLVRPANSSYARRSA